MHRAPSLILCLVLAACDGAPPLSPDAQPDAPAPPDASGRGPVTVRTLDPAGSGVPLLGTRVLFYGPTGALEVDTLVDNDGTARADVLPDSTVVAVFQTYATQYDVEVVSSVAPGDELHLSGGAGDHSRPRKLSLQLPPLAGASYFNTYGPCDDIGSTVSEVVIDASCADRPVFVEAQDSQHAVGFIEIDHLPDPPTTTVAVQGPWLAFAPYTATYSNIPSDVTFVIARRDADHRLGYWDAYTTENRVGSTLTLTGTAAATMSPQTMDVRSFNSTGDAYQAFLETVPGDQLTYALDLGSTYLPWIDQPTLDAPNAVIHIPASGTGSPDLLETKVRFSRSTNTRNYNWILIGPFAKEVGIPTLPSDLIDLVPGPDDNPQFDVRAFEWDTVGSYADAKHPLDDVLGGSTFGGSFFRFPSSKTRVSAFDQF